MRWQVYDRASGRVLDHIEAANHPAAVHGAQARGHSGGEIGVRVDTAELRDLAALRGSVRSVLQHCARVASSDPKADDLGARERVLARWVIATLGGGASDEGGAS